MSAMQNYEILGHVYSSYLTPRVTTGLVSARSDEMMALGYDEVTIETFGNVWTRTSGDTELVEPRQTA